MVGYEYCNGGTFKDFLETCGVKDSLGNKCITDEKVIHSIALQFIRGLKELENI